MAEYNGINFDELQNISKKYNTGSVTAWKINRQNLFQVINGNAFFPLKVWPKAITRAFWSKPLSDMQSFSFFVFFIGNGGSPYIAAEWIVSSLFGRPATQIRKSLYQINWINRNIQRKKHSWFYFDIMGKRQCYLSGNAKRTER